MKIKVPSINIAKSVNIISIGFVMMSSIPLRATAQQVIPLQKAIELSLERNLQIKNAQLNESIDAENLKQARYNRLPNLTAGPQASFNFGRNIDPSTNQYINQHVFGLSGSINSQVLLYQGGFLKNEILENKLLLDVDKSNTSKLKNDLILSVVTTYLQILSNQDLLKAAIQQVDIAKLTLDKVQQNFDVGNNTLADLSQAKAQLSNADLNQTTAQNQLDISVLALKQYMEMNPKTDIAVEKPDISKLTDVKTQYDAQEVFSSSVSVNPDVHLAELQKQAAYQNINIAKSYYYPTLSLSGSLGTNYSDARQQVTGQTTAIVPIGFLASNPSQSILTQIYSPTYGKYPFTNQISDNLNEAVGVSLQIPIFGRFSTRTSLRKAKINYQIAEVNAQFAKNTLNKTIVQAVLDLRAADRKYYSAQQTYQAYKNANNAVQQRYSVGLLSSLDYNTSLTNLNKSEFDMIQARYEVIFKSKVIDYYLGNPIKL